MQRGALLHRIRLLQLVAVLPVEVVVRDLKQQDPLHRANWLVPDSKLLAKSVHVGRNQPQQTVDRHLTGAGGFEMGVTLRDQPEIGVNHAARGIEPGRLLVEPDAESGGIIDLRPACSRVVDLDADIGLRRNHPPSFVWVFKSPHPGHPSHEIAAGVVSVPCDFRWVGDEAKPHPRLVSRPIILITGAARVRCSQPFLCVDQKAGAIVEGQCMVDCPPISRDELGLLDVEFLLVAQGKYNGAVVVLALGGEMNGFRHLEHEVWRT